MPGTVTVACKIPNGLELRLPSREPVVLKGPAVPYGTPPVDAGTGYALTFGVDEEFFGEWMKRNAEMDLVKKRFVFAHAKPESAQSLAREMKDLTTGLEGRDPDKPGKGLERIPVAS